MLEWFENPDQFIATWAFIWGFITCVMFVSGLIMLRAAWNLMKHDITVDHYFVSPRGDGRNLRRGQRL